MKTEEIISKNLKSDYRTKNNFLKEKLNAIRKHERINTLRTILSQPITYYKRNNNVKVPNEFCSTLKRILNSNMI